MNATSPYLLFEEGFDAEVVRVEAAKKLISLQEGTGERLFVNTGDVSALAYSLRRAQMRTGPQMISTRMIGALHDMVDAEDALAGAIEELTGQNYTQARDRMAEIIRLARHARNVIDLRTTD